MYSETTHGITVTVRPVFLDEQSVPAENRYVWAYFVRIENGSDRTVTLRSRWWHITDARGRVQEVRGAYQMEGEDGARLDVRIPAFSLDSPHQAVRLN